MLRSNSFVECKLFERLHAENYPLVAVMQRLPDMKQDFRAYLNPLGYLETHYTRMMSSLSSIAYRMDRLTPRYIRRLHGLELQYTSLACERVLTSDPQPAFETHRFGDGTLGQAPFVSTYLCECELQLTQLCTCCRAL
jgi:hypothetical protein